VIYNILDESEKIYAIQYNPIISWSHFVDLIGNQKVDSKPSFLITIDTEGDNLWDNPKELTTENAKYLYRFQQLCEKYGFKPTYLTNYEMANSVHFQELGKEVLLNKTGEIGMHLHAWDMPPPFELTDNDLHHHPYLIEYPVIIIKEKVKIMTDILEDIFQIKMTSHRAGRWAFNEIYAEILIENGYLVDCSVTPLESWKAHLGNPNNNGGSDYSYFPNYHYFIDPNDISKPGDSSLLEIPMTIDKIERPLFIRESKRICDKLNITKKIINHYFPPITWLRPNGRNLSDLLALLKKVLIKRGSYVEFMLHSSEFMPGGSPTFKTKHSIERLYSQIEQLFIKATENFDGCTLTEYYRKHSN
jgi:hypothetical protein